LLNNKYAKLEAVGHGAYGIVFKGRDSTTGNLVAIKEVKLTGGSQEHLQDVLSEIDLLKSLKHEHIVKYLDSFKSRTHLYIILEFMEKGDLSSVLKPNKFGVFPEPLAAVYIAQILKGLQYLHEQGVVHRDIKGANILTTSEGLVKLADFGVATNLQEPHPGGAQDVVGTPYWMAPEVIEMTEVTAASDVWSVGCLVIELLTGHPPYYEFQPMSALFRIVQDTHPPLPEGISPPLEDFLLQCFQKEASLRPDAKTLLEHSWIRSNRSKRCIRATWSRTKGTRSKRGNGGNVHESVSSVMNRILQMDAEDDDDAGEGTEDAPLKEHVPNAFALEMDDGRSPSSLLAPRSKSTMGVDSGIGSITVNPMLLSRRAVNGQQTGAWPREGTASWEASRMEQSQGEAEAIAAEGGPSPHPPHQSPRWLQRRSVPNSSVYEDYADSLPGASWKGSLMARQNSDAVDSPMATDLLSLALSGPFGSADRGATLRTPKGPRPVGSLAFALAEGGGHSPRGAVGLSPAAKKGDSAMENDQDRVAERRQEKEEAKRLIALLSLESGSEGEGRVIGACQQLAGLLPESADRKACFVTNSGIVAAIELLDSGSTRVVMATLELVNTLVSNDTATLEQVSMMGMVPAVVRFAVPGNTVEIRQQAALFMRQLCFASPRTQQMLIACNGLPVLVGLVEDSGPTWRELIGQGVSCIWHILESQGVVNRVNDFCRMLAHHGLVERLVSCLSSASGSRRRGSRRKSVHPSPESKSALTAVPSLTDTRFSSHNAPGSSDRLAASSPPPSQQPSNSMNNSAGSEAELSAQMQGASVDKGLLDQIANLLLVFSIADSVVKNHLCRRETLMQLFDTVPHLEGMTCLKVLRCIKHLTMDESMLMMLQGDEIICRIVGLMNSQVMGVSSSASPSRSPSNSIHSPRPAQAPANLVAADDEHKLEVVHALYNLCRINKECQERAAREGAVPSLCRLAQLSPDSGSKLRTFAISTLCRLAHASSASRLQLLKANALSIFMRLLSEPRWQAPALDAAVTWLSEDLPRIEPKLMQDDSLWVFSSIFEKWKVQLTAGEGVGELKGLLEIFHRILMASRRINVALSEGPLPSLVVAMLRDDRPMTSLPLLKILRALYEAHPHPKEFIILHRIHSVVQTLAERGKSALVAKQAQNLLDAFQINSIL